MGICFILKCNDAISHFLYFDEAAAVCTSPPQNLPEKLVRDWENEQLANLKASGVAIC